MKDYLYAVTMVTRDYECDIQGVVNNANYQHYLEATRHQWLREEGFSFSRWHDEGIDLMVSEITLKYKMPLRGQEEFLSCFNMRREGARFIFDQDIYRKSDMALCVSGTVSCVCLVNGKLTRGDEIAPYFEKYLK
ncbi:MAG: acyl-CoA thioesterase [Bacteroidales bacterium]|nr:acyl-CoA thioesterase [Bacteroidales bacterium]MBR5056238.1 acyl-CoA thioesterase [Bacteroidales bacterium]